LGLFNVYIIGIISGIISIRLFDWDFLWDNSWDYAIYTLKRCQSG